METRDPRPSPQGLVSQDSGGQWIKTDSNPVTQHTEIPSSACDERPQDETSDTPPAPAENAGYYSVMDNLGADHVFIPPPPPSPPQSYMAPLLPAEGSRDATGNNSSVTLAYGAADATEAKANPRGLDWHHGERQLMAAENKVDEVTASAVQTSKESMDTVSLSKDKDATLPRNKDQTSMVDTGSLMETCHEPTGRHHKDSATGNKELHEKPEDIVTLSVRRENWTETEAQRDQYPKQLSSSIKENTEKETHFDKGGENKSEDTCSLAQADSKPSAENVDRISVETNASMMSSFIKNDHFESCGPPELCQRNQNKMDATNRLQAPEIPTEVSNDDDEHVDIRSLNFNLTKNDWVRRESGTSATLLPISEGSEETKEGQGDEGRRIATDIQQGEQLLQRLQLVQLRQDVHTAESPHTSQQVVQDVRSEKQGVLGTEVDDLKAREVDPTEGEESRFHAVEDEGARGNPMEKEKNESEDGETKATMSLPTMTAEPEHHTFVRTEAGDSDDQSDSWVPGDLSPFDPRETSSTQVPLVSTHHRLSVAETSIEKQIHEAAQEKQNLQRAGGVFNLADNTDVLEIPFKTNISLEPLPTKVGSGQRSDWQFSEQKMQKEISQEIQRELVLVNQGKIPGVYSKGEVRQLKETKLLFEAFQQDNTEGPIRHPKPPSSLIKGRVYPSVLERTRSLEMFSLKSCPVSRAHSLRLYESATSETQKSPDDSRSKSPNGGPRDKIRLSPYPKHDKLARLYRSMDSISTGASSSAVEMRSKTRERNATQESPILKRNPFFKLRPALVLQPEVEKDIREAKEREEELRRQRCTLYGENRQDVEDGEKPQLTPTLVSEDLRTCSNSDDVRRPSRGKLERVWPPPSKTDQVKSEQTQQEPKVQRAGGQKAPLWQRWESGLINGQSSQDKN